MTREMSHDEAFAALGALAVDALDADERASVLAHVSTCLTCRQDLAELRDAASNLAFSASAAAVGADTRDRIRGRLLARAAADGRRSAPSREHTETVSVTLRWGTAGLFAAAAGILLVVSLVVLGYLLRDRARLRDAANVQTVQAARERATNDSLRVAVLSRDSLLAGITGRDVALMTLTTNGTKAPFAYMFWDRRANTWTMIAHNMPELKAGRTYQLWLVTASSKISAGTFQPQNGDAVIRATYALPADQLKALAVTEEPAGGVPQPTGPMIMAVTAGSH
jgi:anti-sigma-K factor RskA